MEKPDPRRRRYYRLTTEGRRVVRARQQSWKQFVALIGRVAGIEHAARLLFGIDAADPLSLTGAAAALIVVALAARYLPARWATRVDPPRCTPAI